MREVVWKTKEITEEMSQDVLHTVEECGLFGHAFVYENDVATGTALHHVHCRVEHHEDLARYRRDQLRLEVLPERERLRKLKRKSLPMRPEAFPGYRGGQIEVDEKEGTWTYKDGAEKKEIWRYLSTEYWLYIVPKACRKDMTQVRLDWHL